MPGRRGTGSARASPAAPPARPAACRSCRHRLTEQLRQCRRLVAERDEVGTIQDRRQHRGHVGVPADPQPGLALSGFDDRGRDQSGAGPRYRMSTNRCGTLARSSASSPASTIRPCSMITTSWHRSWTRSSWWLENSTVAPRAARPDSSPAMASMAIGSRPENGSSSTSRSGSFTRAAISWTRCWLPCDSASRRSAARSARPRRSSQAPTLRSTSLGLRPHSWPR
jgi:hypothetical protein